MVVVVAGYADSGFALLLQSAIGFAMVMILKEVTQAVGAVVGAVELLEAAMGLGFGGGSSSGCEGCGGKGSRLLRDGIS